jgi:hypothetical protein
MARSPGLSFPRQAWQPFDGKARALVPQVDADGNDIAGVRTPDIAAPLATYTGWNLRTPQIGRGGELIGNSGSFFPFPMEQVMRRYSTRERYLTVWDEQAQALLKQGLLLPDDVPAMRQSAESKWDWLQEQYTHR